jgi:hypothetical protein
VLTRAITTIIYGYNTYVSIGFGRRTSRDIARDITAWMEEGELTQEDVAHILQIQQPQVCRILKGQFGRRGNRAARAALG